MFQRILLLSFVIYSNVRAITLEEAVFQMLNTNPQIKETNHALEGVKKEKGLVEQTARKFGFHHMGQFSKAYKDCFGELPSKTLRQA